MAPLIYAPLEHVIFEHIIYIALIIHVFKFIFFWSDVNVQNDWQNIAVIKEIE